MEARDMQPVIPMRKARKKRVGVVRSLHRFNKINNARRMAIRTTPRSLNSVWGN